MANPRIDELRRRIEREPGSRLFSQLAEELRKDGDLAEAIRVARSGLAAHPNYPSARLTLGRALFDTGQFGPARIELEAVLRGAPDNILAARMLAECLEGLGDAGAALLQYRAAQRLSPGDKQIEAQVRSIEHRLAAGGNARTAVAPAAGASGSPAPAGQAAFARSPAGAPVPPPLSTRAAAGAAQAPTGAPVARPAHSPQPGGALVEDFDDVFEPAPAWKRSPEAAPVPKDETILLLEDEAPTLPGAPFRRPADSIPPPPQEGISAPVTLAFEEPPVVREASPSLERPTGPEALAGSDTLAGAPAFVVPPPPPAFEAPSSPASEAPPGLATSLAPGSLSGEARPDPESTSTAAFAAFHEPPPEPAPSWPAPFAPAFSAPAPPVAAPPAVSMAAESAEPSAEAKGAALSTPTLAELYCDQGFYDKAVEVYEKILEREPNNERARARLIEIKALALALSAPPAPDPRAGERRALQHKIARLEQMLAAVRRG